MQKTTSGVRVVTDAKGDIGRCVNELRVVSIVVGIGSDAPCAGC